MSEPSIAAPASHQREMGVLGLFKSVFHAQRAHGIKPRKFQYCPEKRQSKGRLRKCNQQPFLKSQPVTP